MKLAIVPIRPDFCARVEGLDLRRSIGETTFAQLRKALDEHSVLIIPGVPIDDEQQIAFSNQWGPLEPTKGVNPASGTVFARQSNLDRNDGSIIPAHDRRMDYQKGNYQWHADSTFKRTPSLCSILSAREVPPSGGNTEFVSTRSAYERLSESKRRELAALVVVHDFEVSRGRVGFKFTNEEKAIYPPVRHPLVQMNPATERGSLLIGAHASHIDGWDDQRGAELLQELLELATQPTNIYSHRWSDGDVVIWDNRSVLHRATAYDTERHRRLMQRTTVGNPNILDSAAYKAIAPR